VEIVVGVAELTVVILVLNLTRSLIGTSKFVPEIETAVPTVPMVGVKPVIVGAPLEAVTVKDAVLVAEPFGAPTVIGPVVAPVGTVVMICVAVAEPTEALVPLKLTVSWLGVAEKACP